MTIKISIIATILSVLTLGVVAGQTAPATSPSLQPPSGLTTPPPPPIPASIPRADEFVVEIPPARPVAGTPHVAQPHVATEIASRPVRQDSVGQAATPNETELVSILKRNLPQSNQTIEMRDAPDWFQTMMQRIVRDNVPDKYVQDKDWGKTDKRWDGLSVRRKGPLNLTTKRKWKEVNHGTWKRYEITQRNPDENLLLKIENVHDAGKGNVGFEVELASKLHAHGRFAKWAKGIQVYNVSADADAAVIMRLWCEVGMKLDIRKFPPDVVMMPIVTQARMNLTDFKLQSVSKLDGPLVKKLSGSVHKVLLDKIEEKRAQLPKKINKQIAKNKDKMRLSMADFAASKWSSLTSSKSSESEAPADQNSSKSQTPTDTTKSSHSATKTAAPKMNAIPPKPQGGLRLSNPTTPPVSLNGNAEEGRSNLIDLIGPGL